VREGDAAAEATDIGLEHHNGFGRAAGDVHQSPAVAQALQIEEDQSGTLVRDQVLQQVFGVYVQHVPCGHEFVEPDAFVDHQVEYGHAHAAAL